MLTEDVRNLHPSMRPSKGGKKAICQFLSGFCDLVFMSDRQKGLVVMFRVTVLALSHLTSVDPNFTLTWSIPDLSSGFIYLTFG
ncbi:hypothetical protein PoB_002692200 [Plakobranchus ocellatus]|uniref:Uncharacterized protein n=1 Tax=Plakobranchus ocellatus TaxID=259542 RepID=A0AAV4A0N1_9GAST|nr:hypothetical protein PoB_002692200 [Plakobranchus ocellatus]